MLLCSMNAVSLPGACRSIKNTIYGSHWTQLPTTDIISEMFWQQSMVEKADVEHFSKMLDLNLPQLYILI